jgi:hypothetical protein
MAVARASMATVTATTARVPLVFSKVLCDSVRSLSSRLKPLTRVASLDISPMHLSIAISDRDRRRAMPFGILARSGNVSDDARALARAISHAHTTDPRGSLDLAAIVVGAPPGERAAFNYVEDLLRYGENDTEVIQPFPNLDGVLFYSEAETLRRAIADVDDFVSSVERLPSRLETRKFGRFDRAMTPKVDPSDLVNDVSARARISASEILQAFLDDAASSESSDLS